MVDTMPQNPSPLSNFISPQKAELRIDAKQLMAPAANSAAFQWLDYHSLIIDQGLVIDVIPTAQAHKQYQTKQHYKLSQQLLMPGLSNHYCSLGASLFQHLGLELPTQLRWQNYLMPAEQKFVSEELIEVATEYSIAQSLFAATTNFSTHYFFPQVTAKIAKKHKLNCKIGICINPSFSLPNLSSEQQLASGLQLIDDYKHQQHIEFGFSIPNLNTVSNDFLNKLASVSNELALSIDVSFNRLTTTSTDHSKQRPIQRLANFGLLSPDLNIHNPVRLQRQELKTMAESGSTLIVSPSAACLAADGYPPLSEFVTLGGSFVIGSDNLASHNLNMLKELNSLALTSKLIANSATATNADQVLAAALKPTLQAPIVSSQTLGFSKGSEATICAVNLDTAMNLDGKAQTEQTIAHDPSQQIVYTGGQHNISHLWHKGETKIVDARLCSSEIQEQQKSVNQWLNTINQRKY
ncbi:amidohydrolase family protein [Kangiella sp. TOML190]|uniref:amidohydrolase family protein n=1 Tax=Kangiella sp. TOML190 TaxID=2931351 RepID=UPI00203DB88D|nr:amidohydrolase family protein [Kangiella sp. TOML190]